MTEIWSPDSGLTDVTSAFKGFTQPLDEIYDDIHRRGWTVSKVHVKDGKYVAEGKSPHGHKLEATGQTDATAAANLLVKIMRQDFMRSGAARAKLGAWDAYPIEQQFSQIAQAYAGAPVYEPKAASAWMELAQDCSRRAQVIRMQVTVEYTYDPVPYESADEMRADVTKKRKIVVSRAFAHHPVWSEQQMLDYRLVCDVLGHAVGGGDWGWHGTCLAFASLAPLMADSPQKALYTELLGQAAFGTFYRQWGPQKICFLKDLVEKEQAKENKPGHTGVHPSQSIVPRALPHIGATDQADPNSGWDSGTMPLQDNAYMWQRQDGVDPLDSQAVSDSLRPLESGIGLMHPHMAQQAVVNALRGSLLGARSNAMAHAIHYQSLMNVPAQVDDPIAYWDALEQNRERWNQERGYAHGSHKQHWPEEQQFKQWVKAANPHLDDGEVQREAKRELLHMLAEEEERVLAGDQGELLSSEQVEHEAYEAMRKRLGAITKPNVDQKVDFGEHHMFHEAGESPWSKEYLDYMAQATGGSWRQNQDGIPTLDTPQGQAYLHACDSDPYGKNIMSLNGIETEPKGSGLGTSLMDHSRQFADDTGRPFQVSMIGNRSYFNTERFPWMEEHGLGRDLRYTPQQQRTATFHADMYPPYLASRMRPLAQISRHAQELAQAAQEDLRSHQGRGHHFRAKTLGLGIPGLGPRQASNAWLHLAPQTSQLGIIEPQVSEALGHDYATDVSNRDYFKHERELAAGRDASGYGHMPLGAFSAGVFDLAAGGPGWHPDRTPMKVNAPTPFASVNWAGQAPTYPGWTKPYWWESTQEARDQVGKDFDRSIGVDFGKDEVPFRTAAGERQVMYHMSPFSNRESIQRQGLLPSGPDYGDGEEWPEGGIDSGVYMFDHPGAFDARGAWPGNQHQDVWAADVTGLPLDRDEASGMTGSWYSDEGIPPDRLRLHSPASAAPARKIASGVRSPWVTHPQTGERLTGAPGLSLMQHVKDSFGHPDVQSVWNADYEVGKS